MRSGGDVRGVHIAGLGIGAGGRVSGINTGVLAVGSGGGIGGVSIAGLGVGSPRLSGIVLTGVGPRTPDFNGGAIGPFYFRVARSGSIGGVSVSVFNRIGGVQHGLTIGVLNIAEELRGVQIGAHQHRPEQPERPTRATDRELGFVAGAVR